ncbi:unnamed protein product [Orchesella dallaii]|uniref:Uncharacterized protein n=1 Tax=Orchesella dallaii TaxID=48710 RepID=A0ABP1RDG5_9HEXA
MISSMPAIPVRRERQKKEGSIGYFSRPHKLSLHFRPPALSHHQVTPTPSPINSPQGVTDAQQSSETRVHRLARLVAQKRVFFQLSVLFPLAGALLLFIGLIQLVPGAEGKPYGMLLVVIGCILLVIGLLIIIVRLCCKWELERCETSYLHGGVLPEIKVNEPSLNDVDIEKAGELESSYSQQQSRRPSQQNSSSNTAGLEQVHVDTSGAYSKSSSGGGGGGGGATAPFQNYHYSPLNFCKPDP